MSRLVTEDAVFYLMSFYLISSIIFGAGIFNTYLPGKCYNSTSYSLEICDTTPTPMLWGGEDNAAIMEKYNMTNSSPYANPGAMLDPTKLVGMVGFYVGFLFDMVSNTMLTVVLTAFIGSAWARVITFVLNIIIVVTVLRVISGRLRFD